MIIILDYTKKLESQVSRVMSQDIIVLNPRILKSINNSKIIIIQQTQEYLASKATNKLWLQLHCDQQYCGQMQPCIQLWIPQKPQYFNSANCCCKPQFKIMWEKCWQFTLKPSFPHSVAVCQARHDVVQNTEFELKLIMRALPESKQNMTILAFIHR